MSAVGGYTSDISDFVKVSQAEEAYRRFGNVRKIVLINPIVVVHLKQVDRAKTAAEIKNLRNNVSAGKALVDANLAAVSRRKTAIVIVDIQLEFACNYVRRAAKGGKCIRLQIVSGLFINLFAQKLNKSDLAVLERTKVECAVQNLGCGGVTLAGRCLEQNFVTQNIYIAVIISPHQTNDLVDQSLYLRDGAELLTLPVIFLTLAFYLGHNLAFALVHILQGTFLISKFHKITILTFI